MIVIELPYGVHNEVQLDRLTGCTTYHGVTAEVGRWLREHQIPWHCESSFEDGDEQKFNFSTYTRPPLRVLFDREADAVLFKLTWL